MRVLLPATEFPPFPGGVSTVAYEQASGLARLGHVVRVETLDFSQHGPPPSVHGYELFPRRVRARAVIRLLPLCAILVRSAASFRPDIIHCPQYRGYGLPTAVVAAVRRIPYTLYIHGTDVRTEMGNPARRAIVRSVLSRATRITTNSSNTARMLREFFPDLSTPVQPLPPGVHADRFQSDTARAAARALRGQWLREFIRRGAVREDEADQTVVALAMCRMSRQKGIDVLLEALRHLWAEGLAAPLVLVLAGTGPDLGDFQQQAQQAGIAQRILFAGAVAYAETPAYFLAADLYVQPSQPIGDFLESFGISFLEAQASGLPCIGSEWGGVPEAVRDGETARLVRPGDLKSLATAILELATNSELRRAMGEAGVRHATEFSWEAHCSRLADLLQETLL